MVVSLTHHHATPLSLPSVGRSCCRRSQVPLSKLTTVSCHRRHDDDDGGCCCRRHVDDESVTVVTVVALWSSRVKTTYRYRRQLLPFVGVVYQTAKSPPIVLLPAWQHSRRRSPSALRRSFLPRLSESDRLISPALVTARELVCRVVPVVNCFVDDVAVCLPTAIGGEWSFYDLFVVVTILSVTFSCVVACRWRLPTTESSFFRRLQDSPVTPSLLQRVR